MAFDSPTSWSRDLDLTHALVAAEHVFDLDRARRRRFELVEPEHAADAGRIDAVLGRQHGHDEHHGRDDERDGDAQGDAFPGWRLPIRRRLGRQRDSPAIEFFFASLHGPPPGPWFFLRARSGGLLRVRL